MKLVLFGGTFDPIHMGHLLLAEYCREQVDADRIIFMPAGIPPHKKGQRRTPGSIRAEMLELAVHGNPAFEVDRFEIDRTEVSYTVDTLRHLSEKHPDAELFFLVGADMLFDLPNWYRGEEICRLATPIAAQRPGSPPPDFGCLAPIVPDPSRRREISQHLLDMPRIDLSSTNIRQRVEEGRSIRYQTPRDVELHIHSEQLYKKGQ